MNFYAEEIDKQNIAFISKELIDDDYYAQNYQRRYYYDVNDPNLRNERTIDYYENIDKNFIMKNRNYPNNSIKIKTNTVIDQKAGIVKDDGIFNNNVAYTATKEKFDLEKYTPIAKLIEKELGSLQDFRTKIEKPYTENLFAQQSFKEIITSKIEDEKKKLEDLKLELTKQKNRYE